MSDSIKKYHELVEEGRIDPNTSYEDKREAKILALISQAAKANKLYEVYTRAETVKNLGEEKVKEIEEKLNEPIPTPEPPTPDQQNAIRETFSNLFNRDDDETDATPI